MIQLIKKILISIFQLFKCIFSKNIVIYAIIALIVFKFIDFSSLLDKQRAESLNELMPTYGALIDFNDNKIEKWDQNELDTYLKYYSKVDEFAPDISEIQFLLGYFNYYNGDKKNALKFFDKAISLNDKIFWYHFNRAIILYDQEKYDKSIASLNKALGTLPEHALLLITTSKIFRGIMIGSGSQNFEKALKFNLQQGYAKTYALLIFNYLKEKKYDDILKVASYAASSSNQYLDFFYYYAGFAAYNRGMIKEAIFFFNKSISVNQNNPDSYYFLGLCFKMIKQDTLAEEMIKKAYYLNENKQNTVLKVEDIKLKIF